MFSTDKSLSKILYLVGVITIFLAVYSQYFIELGQIGGFLVVYGLPIAVVSLFFGKELLKRAAKNNKTAIKFGMGLFGAISLVGILLSIVVIALLLFFNPQTLDLLNRPNPVLDIPPNLAWLMIAISFLVVGPAEEYLFRGFMYGGLLSITKGRHWLPMAIVSSLLFALVHAYYAITYGIASIIAFITLTGFAFAMAVTYYWSDGNILIPAIIHGLYDATGFLGVALSDDTISVIARGVLMSAGLVFAVLYLPQKIRLSRTEKSSNPPEPSSETPTETSLPPPPAE
jgi:membrane protease YdiL (CAAX protease family)